MHRRQRQVRATHPAVPIVILAVMLLLVTVGSVAAALGTHRPHMGASQSDQGTVYWNPVRNTSDPFWVTANRWGGCRTLVRWYVDPTVPSAWSAAISSAVGRWDNPSYCGPDFIKTTDPAAARLKFRVEDKSYCGLNPSGTPLAQIKRWIAVACRNSASNSSAQVWTIAFNDEHHNFGLGASGRFDVDSIVTNEMGHVLYLDHNTGWTDGTVQANSCTWGTTSCLVTNDLQFSDFAQYTASCSNCGSRRAILTGDWQVVRHIYGLKPCTGSVCPNGAPADTASKPTDPGPLSPEELQTELDAQDPASTTEFWHDVHVPNE